MPSPIPHEPTAAAELRRGWPLIAAAGTGAGLGLSGLLPYTAGLFQPALARAAGLSPGRYGLALFLSTVVTAAAVPWVGRAVDRMGARRVAASGAALLTIGFLLLAVLSAAPGGFLVAMALTGLLGAGCTPVPFTRAISAAFVRARGTALGLTQVGIGLSAALVPLMVARTIADHGWRAGYLLLAVLALAAAVPALTLLPGPRGSAGAESAPADAVRLRGTRLYRVQLATFAAMAFAFAGMLSHFVPLLVRGGVSLAQAGALAGAIGLSVIVSRLVIGWLADRVDPAWLGMASCLVCAGGCLLLAIGGPAAALWGAIAFGTAMGAEADLIAILTARHFPIAAYGRLYAPQYAAFTLAAGVSPLWIGLLVDRLGSYRPPLFAAAALLLVPAMLFALLPHLRRRDMVPRDGIEPPTP